MPGELGAQQPPRQRHQRLKYAEIRADEQRLLFVDRGHGQTLTDGHREGIHAQADAYQKNLQ